ncbi:hypothetical protein B1T50_13155 [Mycobacterium kansasii]|nr:hypothetical protein B1T50_13155 [Mycobacterium kansasii]
MVRRFGDGREHRFPVSVTGAALGRVLVGLRREEPQRQVRSARLRVIDYQRADERLSGRLGWSAVGTQATGPVLRDEHVRDTAHPPAHRCRVLQQDARTVEDVAFMHGAVSVPARAVGAHRHVVTRQDGGTGTDERCHQPATKQRQSFDCLRFGAVQ